ncbi:MAG: rhamnogalacturonan lyase [Prevotella sp.]|nr:rhamnogalacturonan lyase [Prevotella sp.]
MKRLLTILLCALTLTGYAQTPGDTPESQMEKLDRGLVVVRYPQGKGFKYFASWRMLGTDDTNTTFALLKNGETLKDGISGATSVDSITATADDRFQVVTYQNGTAVETSAEVAPWTNYYLKLPLDKPAAGALGGTYSPNDCSVGDVDGDGQYEIIVKWDPSNSKDNSQSDKTDNVFLDCYKLDGTKLWRIDLGVNIRAGAHYTQFMVYDFDKDGRAELMCKTAPGSIDGQGNYVNQAATDDNIKAADNTKDWRTAAGRINGGQEYLTVFNGETGAAIHTIAYYPNRNAKAELSEAAGTFNWDDRSGKNDKGDYGNRGERYLACVAYLAGPDQRPSGVFCRGYYTFAYLWAVDFDGSQLKTRWLHSSDKMDSYRLMDADGNEQRLEGMASTSGHTTRKTMYANGNHNLSVADVDGDGCDEIIWGSAALDNDGRLLYCVGFGHGDAIHLGDLNPDRPGLELFDVHEEKGEYAWDMHDAATGEIIWKGGQKGQDNGRGLAADIVESTRGYEFWSSYGGFDSNSRNQNPYNAISGTQAASTKPSMNFRIYWDGDALDELLDNTTISKYGGSNLGVGSSNITGQSNNGTKATPNLSADIFGDWREELILRSSSNDALNIFTTITPTDYRVPTLMHDHTYRLAVAWQNVAYNQPPHLGYYLPDFIDSFQGSGSTGVVPIHKSQFTIHHSVDVWYTLDGRKLADAPTKKGVYIQNGKKLIIK